jgi:phosphatidate cytidylyltransferase
LWGRFAMSEHQSPPKKSDLGVRTASAVVMVAFAGTALWLGGWCWTVLVAVVAAGVLWEWIALVRRFAANGVSLSLWTVAGVLYVGLASAMLIFLRAPMATQSAIVTLLVCVIATDIGAYFAGRTFGGPKIAPAISPSKTWAGLIGGALASGAVFAWFTVAYRTPGDLVPEGIPPEAVGIGAIIAVIAQAGDFFESWMKRRAGVKDSGHLIPGHGGLFDRVDGLLAVSAAAGLFFLLIGWFRLR